MIATLNGQESTYISLPSCSLPVLFAFQASQSHWCKDVIGMFVELWLLLNMSNKNCTKVLIFLFKIERSVLFFHFLSLSDHRWHSSSIFQNNVSLPLKKNSHQTWLYHEKNMYTTASTRYPRLGVKIMRWNSCLGTYRLNVLAHIRYVRLYVIHNSQRR